MTDNVVKFPPLPPVTTPPSSAADQRQKKFMNFKANLTAALSGNGAVGAANAASGFRAAAVDLGALQEMVERGLAAFNMDQVRERWDDEVLQWITSVIRAWVQRCKSMHYDLAEKGIHVKLETQDEWGYYDHEFDVFPGRKRTSD